MKNFGTYTGRGSNGDVLEVKTFYGGYKFVNGCQKTFGEYKTR